MSKRRRHPQRHVEGKRATLEWGKAGKRLMLEQRRAHRLSRQLTHRILGGEER